MEDMRSNDESECSTMKTNELAGLLIFICVLGIAIWLYKYWYIIALLVITVGLIVFFTDEHRKPPDNKNVIIDTHQSPEINVAPVVPAAPILKKNQLGTNDYVIGKDIPSGIYDVIWIWGHGSVTLSKDETTTLGATKFFKWVGDRYDYEQRQCMNIVCEEGNHLHVSGSVIVEIRKSKPVEIAL